MSTILMVPIHLDALHLAFHRSVVEARADFSRLPYSDRQRDYNADVANLSEDIVSQPFQNDNLHLEAGIHLHWALPDALTSGAHDDDNGITHPPVPDRWLVTRTAGGDTTRWIVESNYLFPDGQGDTSGSVSFPVVPDPDHADPDQRTYRPFRYLGRTVTYESWQENDADSTHPDYLHGLTALGYGEPAFAAFYPNCHSVFGFHDDAMADDFEGVRYDVLGWYSNPDDDPLRALVAADPTLTRDALLTAIEETFGWKVILNDGQDVPERLYCRAAIVFGEDTSSPNDGSQTTVTVANTGTEALSTRLATMLDDGFDEDLLKEHKATFEDQLEALHLAPGLAGSQVDTGPRFNEARHEKGFTALAAGTLWTVRQDSAAAAPADADAASAQITLPESLAGLLNDLNVAQQAYDQAREEIESMRARLFSDWYKYMLCSCPPDDARDEYPDIDEAKHYLRACGVDPIHDKEAATGSLELLVPSGGSRGEDAASDTGLVKASGMPQGSLAEKLAGAIVDAQAAVTTHNNSDAVRDSGAVYLLKAAPAARYWQPNEPVVLVTGPRVKATERHGQDGVLECQAAAAASDVTAIPASTDVSTWNGQPWNPLLLEWEVEVFPVREGGNSAGSYTDTFITANHTLPESEPDFDGYSDTVQGANVYSGSSYLANQAESLLQGLLEHYLDKNGIDPTQTTSRQYASANLGDDPEEQADDPVYTALRAYEILTSDDFYSLSQSLGGFNDALLMHKQTPQLSITDPLGFAEYQEIAQQVADAVEDGIESSPLPLDAFNPIRSGALRINALRLVDTFGQVKDLDPGDVAVTELMKSPAGSGHPVWLPPRLAQPARLDFRWLSAGADKVEMNAHPATSALCGWVLTNHLDNSLMIYDGAGKALGSIDQNAVWEPAPGSAAAVGDPQEIGNGHLRQMVDYVLRKGASFLSDFIRMLDNAMANIEPDNAEQLQGMAVLTGQPVALVRASVDLQLKGLPAVDHSWDQFRLELDGSPRNTDGFPGVRVPIRLGEFAQLNDGLVGYWVEKADGTGYEDDLFYVPQSNALHADNGGDPTVIDATDTDDSIVTRDEALMHLCQSIGADPQVIAMLVDPRGVVHATSGLLPTASVSIPPDQYADALQAIEVTFLTTPLLTHPNQLRIPLPDEPGYQWAWLEKDKATGTEGGTVWLSQDSSTIGAVTTEAAFDGVPEVREGWLKLSVSESA